MARRRATSVSDTDEDFLWSGLARRPKITKVIFRPCGLSASLRHHEFLARWSPGTILQWAASVDCYGILRRISRSVECISVQISVSPRHTVGVRATGAGCAQQSGVCYVSGGPERPGVPFAQKPVSEETRVFRSHRALD